ncbi:MAG TPA: tetratricopeptide repeat protein, partial [Thermoanaerobaculia bacterium]
HPDLLALYLIGTDEIGHVFAPYVPPRLDCITEADFARYSGTVDAYYGVVDAMLGQWMRRAKEDGATLIVHSDHGFKWGADRRCERSSQDWSTAAYWHRYDGVFAAWGARVVSSPRRGNMTVFDVAPTVSALLSVPVDAKASGKVAPAFGPLAAPRKDAEAPEVRRVAAKQMSAEESDEYAKKLRALGYLSGAEAPALAPSGGDRPDMTEGAWNNLGLYLREEKRDLAAAEKAFQQALALRPNYHSPMFNLAILYRTRGDDAQAREWLFRSLDAGHAEPERTIALWYEQYRDGKKEPAARALMERAVQRFPSNEAFARELALSRFRGRDCAGALEALTRYQAATREPATLNALGLFHTCLGRRPEAIRLFEQSLSIDPNQPGVVQSLKVVRGG